MHPIHILGKVADVVRDLQAQLSRRTQHQGLRAASRGVNPHQQGDTKSSRLTRTRLSKGNHIVLVL